MIEIIVMIMVMIGFWKTARRRQLNPFVWFLIGGLSYFIPAKLFGNLVYVPMVQDYITNDNWMIFIIIGAVLSILVGGIFCFLAYRTLLSKGKESDNPFD